MDVVKAAKTYLARLISEVAGIKVLLLDAHTVRVRAVYPAPPVLTVPDRRPSSPSP